MSDRTKEAVDKIRLITKNLVDRRQELRDGGHQVHNAIRQQTYYDWPDYCVFLIAHIDALTATNLELQHAQELNAQIIDERGAEIERLKAALVSCEGYAKCLLGYGDPSEHAKNCGEGIIETITLLEATNG